jgi:hypothetical protein
MKRKCADQALFSVKCNCYDYAQAIHHDHRGNQRRGEASGGNAEDTLDL